MLHTGSSFGGALHMLAAALLSTLRMFKVSGSGFKYLSSLFVFCDIGLLYSVVILETYLRFFLFKFFKVT